MYDLKHSHTYVRKSLASTALIKTECFAFLDIKSAYACYEDTVTLSCADNSTILVASAYYGQFAGQCSFDGITCCPPHPGQDCTGSMEEDNPQDWLALKALCDDQATCDVTNLGGYISSCATSNVVDYVTVYYQCLPGSYFCWLTCLCVRVFYV